ncbi:MAG: hypothetical protein ACREBS_01260 [Nitrososphaerales archaeon]
MVPQISDHDSGSRKVRKSNNPSEKKAEEEHPRCDFCGVAFDNIDISLNRRERGKFCSTLCQRRATRGRIAGRLAMPVSKRYARRLRFSNPLYFN